MIGQKEIERPRVSTTASVQTYGRDSLNYAPGIEQHYVVSTEQIMALENLKGYWKYGDAVVPFRIEPIKRPKRARAFVPRSTLPPIKPFTHPDHFLSRRPPSPPETVTITSAKRKSKSKPPAILMISILSSEVTPC